jgi:formate dehydrogenase subunit gamma
MPARLAGVACATPRPSSPVRAVARRPLVAAGPRCPGRSTPAPSRGPADVRTRPVGRCPRPRARRRRVAHARAFLGDDGTDQSALLPILHALQHAFGFVAADAIPLVADRVNVTKADVRGFLSFYHDFRTTPPGRHEIALCRADACQARGSEALAALLAERHGLRPGETTGDVSLKTAYCIGNCALGPAALIDGDRLVGRLDADRADALVAAFAEEAR